MGVPHRAQDKPRNQHGGRCWLKRGAWVPTGPSGGGVTVKEGSEREEASGPGAGCRQQVGEVTAERPWFGRRTLKAGGSTLPALPAAPLAPLHRGLLEAVDRHMSKITQGTRARQLPADSFTRNGWRFLGSKSVCACRCAEPQREA